MKLDMWRVLAVLALLAASCGETQEAEVRAEPASQEEASEAQTSNSEQDADTTDGESTDDGSSNTGDSSTTGDLQASALGDKMIVQRFTIPYVPPVALPDVSVLSETGTTVNATLGDFAGPETGLDVVSAECAQDGGRLVYNGSDEAGSFFDVDTDGAGTYEADLGERLGKTDITIRPDGSGTYERYFGTDGNIDIEVNADGSGKYEHVFGDEGNLSIEVDGAGHGTYSHVFGEEGNVDVVINSDGSGRFEHNFSGDGNIDLVVNADGSGSFEHTFSEEGNIDVVVDADGTRRYEHVFGPDGNVDILVNPDGSGRFEHDFSANGNVLIEVDSDGNGTYSHDFGPNGDVETTFKTEIGILDPELLVIGPEPTFAVADRFPPLAKLGNIQPPCVTVIRLDANVLFDFDSDQLRPEAALVVENVATALAASGKSLEVHGHTDSKGDDAYNQDLSERRAASFAAALAALGLSNEIITQGFGETRPVAPNETADGADDPAARQLNRRIEIVIPE